MFVMLCYASRLVATLVGAGYAVCGSHNTADSSCNVLGLSGIDDMARFRYTAKQAIASEATVVGLC